VSVVDTKTLQVIKTIPVGKIPWGVAIGSAPGSGK
jgi:YVTN family beta-propeller protein